MTDIVERLRETWDWPHSASGLAHEATMKHNRDGEEAAAEIERLRSELEAVKREAVEALKPFAREANDWDAEANGGFQFADDERADFECSIRVGSLRAARAFVEKHGRDG
jgi:hypothetical protein